MIGIIQFLLDKDFYLNKQPHEQAKVFQVITNAGDDGGYDEKPEYATLDEAIQAGDQYIADGYIGFSVFNTDTKHIEYTDGDFNITKDDLSDRKRNVYH